MKFENDSIFEYSYSKDQAKKILNKLKAKDDKIYFK